VPIYTSSSPELFTRFSISTPWALLALKDFDASGATAVYHKRFADKANISKWLIANRIPTTVELSQETFQLVMNAPHKPLVVIASVNKGKKEKVAEKMKEIGKKWRVRKLNKGNRDVVFTWMDTDKWASWLKNMYGVKATEEPTVIIADHSVSVQNPLELSMLHLLTILHQRLQYYDRDQAGQTIKLTSLSVFATLDGIDKGSIPSKSSENFAERISRVCLIFLHFCNGRLKYLSTVS
jgi:thioredoxin domain-containing protein 5